MPRARLVYRKQHTTLALVTRAEARTVGAAIVGRRHVNVKGQRHMFVYLHPNQRASLRRRARGSVVTELVVDGRRVRAYPSLPAGPPVFFSPGVSRRDSLVGARHAVPPPPEETDDFDEEEEEEDEKQYIKDVQEMILNYLNRSDNANNTIKTRVELLNLLGESKEAKRLKSLLTKSNSFDGWIRRKLTQFTSLSLEDRNKLIDLVMKVNKDKRILAEQEGITDLSDKLS